jgi:type VI secretion system secreted protein VgrG
MALTQAERAIEIYTPLGADVLLFHRMTAAEALGRLFRFDLELLSKDPDIKFEDLLGQNVAVRLELPEDKIRYFNGFISRFSLSGSLGDLSVYTATVRPWLWFLTRTADCRIFQEMTVPDIIKQVFRDQGFTDFEEALSGSYRTWTYCVQYRETDFNFISRLMEQEGIYYYFKHEKNKHTLVLSDSVSSHEPYPGYEKIPFFPPDEHLRREEHHIHEWTVSQEIQPGTYALNDYDFERPRANLQVKSSIPRSHVRSKMEIFDYPGEYTQTGDGENCVRARIEELQTEYEQVQGQTNARGFSVGSLFELVDFPRQDQNREYLVVSATHELESDAYTSGLTSEVEDVYSSSFTVISSKQPYRQARTTPKPMVQGPQTAVVVGPSGEKVYTDEYGRVKVQFHWDRYSKHDENSSCWIRVSQAWAGKRWGSMHIPHVGQEVIVDFLEGDPDRPIITGRVYNANNMSPDPLPDRKTRSIISDNFGNEIVFDATPGNEHILLHCPNHSSTINLGKSIEFKSVSHERKYTHGNTSTVRVGMTNDFFHGSKFSWGSGAKVSGFLGVNADIFVGGKLNVNWGPKFSYDQGGSISINKNYKYTWCKNREIVVNKLDYIRASSEDIVHDSEGTYRAIGGENDNSIVECAKKRLMLAYGEGEKGVNVKSINKNEMIAGALTGAVASLSAAGAAGSAAANFARENQAPYDPDDPRGSRELEWPDFWGNTGLTASLLGLNAAGMASLTLGREILKPLEDKKATHSTVHSKIKLNENGVVINAGGSMINIMKDGDIFIETKNKDVQFVNCKEIKFIKFAKIKENMFQLTRCKLNHAYLTVEKG